MAKNKKKKPADFINFEERPKPFTAFKLSVIIITAILIATALDQIFKT